MRDGSEPLHHVLAAHADAIVFDREAFVVSIDQERDAQRRVIAEQVRAGDGFVTQLFAGVGGVRNQLADEDLLVGIDRMDDQVEELGDIGLERPAFATGLINDGHGRRIPLEHRTAARAGAGSTPLARQRRAEPIGARRSRNWSDREDFQERTDIEPPAWSRPSAGGACGLRRQRDEGAAQSSGASITGAWWILLASSCQASSASSAKRNSRKSAGKSPRRQGVRRS